MRYTEIECTSRDGKKSCVVLSTFAGKVIRGVAKCDTSLDSYDREKGMALAKARCNVKVAEKRAARARKKYVEAKLILEQAERYVKKMESYMVDSAADLVYDKEKLNELEAFM